MNTEPTQNTANKDALLEQFQNWTGRVLSAQARCHIREIIRGELPTPYLKERASQIMAQIPVEEVSLALDEGRLQELFDQYQEGN